MPWPLVDPVLRGELDSGTRDEVPPAEIARIRDAVRRDGYALTSGGVVAGVASVSAPVFSAEASLPLAVAIALPARVVTGAVLEEVTACLLDATGAMSVELGHRSRSA